MLPMSFTPRINIAAITDEFSPDLAAALPVMREIGMTSAELRVVYGKNIVDLSNDEQRRAKEQLTGAGVSVISIASPLLKCPCRAITKWIAGSSTMSSPQNIPSTIRRGSPNGHLNWRTFLEHGLSAFFLIGALLNRSDASTQ